MITILVGIASPLTELVTISNEKAVPALAGPDTTRAGMGMQTEETTSRTTVLATPASVVSSVRRTVVPSVRRISTAVTYGLDQLESEGTPFSKAVEQVA